VRKAQISVESYLVYQSVSQKPILCDVYFITLNDIDVEVKLFNRFLHMFLGKTGHLPRVMEILCLFASGAHAVVWPISRILLQLMVQIQIQWKMLFQSKPKNIQSIFVQLYLYWR
jgi:hypothetical protein